MSFHTFTTWLVSSTALLLSIGALLAAVHLWRQYRKTSSGKLSARLSEIESTLEALTIEQKRIRMARNMAAHRARQSSDESSADPPLTVTDPKEIERREGDRLLANRLRGV